MIKRVRTVGFKGFDIDEPVYPKAIYNGKNRSGKSTRAAAIALALYGYIPFSDVGKRPGDILDAFGGDLLGVAVTIGDTEFGRKFSRSKSGVASGTVQINKKKASKENFAILLDRAGAPKIADVSEFMKQSDAKKVDTLFELYPNPELASIDTEIENAKADVSRIEKKKTGAESTVQRLTSSKQAIEVPAGSISEIQAGIKEIETHIIDLENQIKHAEIEEARVEAEESGKQKEKERAEQEAADKLAESEQLKTDEDWERSGINTMPSSPEMVESDKVITRMENDFDSFRSGTAENSIPEPFQSILQSDVFGSIQRIIEAMKDAGCYTCAALIVAKQELKKYKGVS